MSYIYFQPIRETYSVLIRKKLYFMLVQVTFKSSTNLQKLYLAKFMCCTYGQERLPKCSKQDFLR